jgi:hypothetical protein
MPEPNAFINTHVIACLSKTANIDLQTPIHERDQESEYSHRKQETAEEATQR